ncbi:MAG: hypothetical protein ACI4OR_04355 [Alphaproteobacteria bacterium]
MMKRMRIWGMFLLLLWLAGCDSNVPYNAEMFRASPDNCWPCKMYMQAFKAIDGVLDGSLNIICQNSLMVLELALLFWLLFRVARVVGAFSMPNMKKEFSSFITVLFKAMIVALFLNNPTYLYDFFGATVIQPIGDGFLSMANIVLETPQQSLGIGFNYRSGILREIQDIINALSGSSSSNSVSDSRMFGGLAVSVQGMVYQIYDALWANVGLGFQLWTMKGWSATIAGIILIAGMLWLVVMMPLSFVDAFVRIGLIIMLSPLLMVGWVFSYPKGIVKTVFHNLFAGFFDILFSCIYITFLISTFRVYENQEMPYMFSASVQTTEGGMRTTAENFGTDFLILTMLAWVMVKLSGKIQDFSKYFFDSAGKSSMIDAVNAIKNLAVKGIRVGAALLSGPVGAVAGIAGAAKDLAKEVTNTESGENGSGDKADDKQEEGQQDNSQKASKQNKAPSKEGKK